MLLLPVSVNVEGANDVCRLLTQALQRETQAEVVVDASNLQHFDSSVLAVLIECQRVAQSLGKSFSLRNTPPKLVDLAQLYGVDALVTKPAVKSNGAIVQPSE